MAMAVVITNITDAAEKVLPQRIAIYTAHLDPGESLKLPATHVDARLRKLETQGVIAIGQLPSWYAASKAKKVGNHTLTAAQIKEKFSKKSGRKGGKHTSVEEAKAETASAPFPGSPFKKKEKKQDDAGTVSEDKKNDKT